MKIQNILSSIEFEWAFCTNIIYLRKSIQVQKMFASGWHIRNNC